MLILIILLILIFGGGGGYFAGNAISPGYGFSGSIGLIILIVLACMFFGVFRR